MKSIVKAIRWRLCTFCPVHRLYRRCVNRRFRGAVPDFTAVNRPLRTMAEVEEAVAQIRRIDLPLHRSIEKNWDTLTAITLALRECPDRSTPILDAGGMGYAAFLPAMYLYGYRDLVAVNLGFRRDFRQGPIRYLRGDITKLAFGDAHFGMVFCQSVIEHGVPLERYFAEMARVVKPGGLLVTSTDYWEPKLTVQDARAYGEQVDVFDAGQIRQALELARQAGWEPTCPPEFDCRDRVVYWERMGIRFTFYSLVLRRCLRREDGPEEDG